MMRFTSLGSGSEGNALVVEAASGTTTTRILLDCGFSAKEIVRRLARADLTPEDLDAILITHEHADHIGSAPVLARKFKIPLYMSWGTSRAVKTMPVDVDVRYCECAVALAIGDLEILPYTVPHDAREPLQFVFSTGASRLGVLTDAGSATPHITTSLQGCDALILECNHDREMLANSRYHAALKARIGGSHGHLANDTAAEILSGLETARLRHIVAAHLSRENNLVALAQQAIATTLATAAGDVMVASQEDGFPWLSA